MRTFPSRLVTPLLAVAALALPAVFPGRADANPPGPPQVQTVALFDASKLETPESIAIDHHDNIFLSLALTGEIRKIAPDGTQTTHALLPVGPPLTSCGPFIGIMGAIALDPHGNIYAAVASCIPGDRGIWKVAPDGSSQLLAGLPPLALPDGVVYRKGQVYVTDAEQGLIWRAPADGSGPAAIWADDPLLKPSVGHVFPGPNGLQVFDDEIYVSNSDQADILAIKIKHDGSAGAIRVHSTGTPCDDFAFDEHGNLYCGTDPFGTLLKIAPDGTSHVVLTTADGLDGPTSVAFGRGGNDEHDLYLANGAFPFFSVTHRPSLLRVHLGVVGHCED
jgi:sugar lactone lactonase YvrE